MFLRPLVGRFLGRLAHSPLPLSAVAGGYGDKRASQIDGVVSDYKNSEVINVEPRSVYLDAFRFAFVIALRIQLGFRIL